jgi:hypothetical protein
MPQFIGYHVRDDNRDFPLPMATGDDPDKTMEVAFNRAVAANLNGSITVQLRDDIHADTFAKLGAMLDDRFEKMGIKV